MSFDSSFHLIDSLGNNVVGPGTNIDARTVRLYESNGGEIFLWRDTNTQRNVVDGIESVDYIRFQFRTIFYPSKAPKEKLNLKIGNSDTEILQYFFVPSQCGWEKLSYIEFNGVKVFDSWIVRE